MNKISLILTGAALSIFIACGGNQSQGDADAGNADAEEMHDHEGHDHEGHDHGAMENNSNEMTSAADGARVFFGNLQEGDVVTSPVKVEMKVEGMTVHPAGEAIEGTGHHHLIINEGPTPEGIVVPADETHIHFGGGQEETELELEPGTYTITMQFADGLHRSYGENMSNTIQIEVSAE